MPHTCVIEGCPCRATAVEYQRAADAREYANGHLSLCEMLTGGDNPWCSCGYETWRELAHTERGNKQ